MKLYTYGPEEAKEINETCFKTPGKGAYEFRYVDVPKAAKIMRAYREKMGLGMKVEIVLKREMKMRKQSSFVKNYRNNVCPFTHLIYGKFKGINPVSLVAQWDNVELTEFQSYDLTNDADAADWMILRLSSAIDGSVSADRSSEFPQWQFNDLRATNVDNISKIRDIVKIDSLVKVMSGYDLLNLARLFNFVTTPGDTTLTPIDIEGFLLRIAYEDPTAWLLKYKDGNRSFHELLCAGQVVGSIKYNYVEGWSAMGNQLGQTEADAIAFLKMDKNLYSLIKTSITQNDILANRMEQQRPEKISKDEKLGLKVEKTNLEEEPDALDLI